MSIKSFKDIQADPYDEYIQVIDSRRSKLEDSSQALQPHDGVSWGIVMLSILFLFGVGFWIYILTDGSDWFESVRSDLQWHERQDARALQHQGEMRLFCPVQGPRRSICASNPKGYWQVYFAPEPRIAISVRYNITEGTKGFEVFHLLPNGRWDLTDLAFRDTKLQRIVFANCIMGTWQWLNGNGQLKIQMSCLNQSEEHTIVLAKS